jgi:hypothetical protein
VGEPKAVLLAPKELERSSILSSRRSMLGVFRDSEVRIDFLRLISPIVHDPCGLTVLISKRAGAWLLMSPHG